MRRYRRVVLFAASLALMLSCGAPEDELRVDWPVYGGDLGGMKYSPLTQIDRGNVHRLELAWAWNTGERPVREEDVEPVDFEATPLMIDDTLYLSTPYHRVVALDAGTGTELWSYDPHTYEWASRHRGVATWTDGMERRVFLNTRSRLIALDASTGEPIPEFGQGGEVDLTADLIWEVNKGDYTQTSPPVVYKDLVIVGSSVADGHVYERNPPGDVQAFDVRTGERVWTFHTIPQEGEFGNETWEDGSWSYTGSTNVWAPFTVDEKRGLVYLPVSTPNSDFYGGQRKGDNLFAETIVCLDAETGQRVWHFQTIHHGVWDHDLPAPPTLVTIRVEGETIDAVVVLGKTGFAYVFDRVTGKPVWPIEERPVPQSDVPGEQTSATQPFPTKPPPFSRQAFTLDDLVDFTPELRAMAIEKMEGYRIGSIFTPPSLEGTVIMKEGANWGDGAFDPENGILYVRAENRAQVLQLVRSEPGAAVDYENAGFWLEVADGIPINKPPYAVLTAIDLNVGEHVWQVPLGDSPEIRNHPLLQGLDLPTAGMMVVDHGLSGSLVTRGGLVFISGGGAMFYAIDKTNGETIWEVDLGGRGTGNPMTYQTRSGRQFVVIATGKEPDAELMAFALPPR